MGETPVLAWRGLTGDLKVFANRCAGGTGLIATKALGVADDLACSCHGWRYGPDGIVIDRPHLRTTQVAQVAAYKGLLFATFDPNAPSLAAYLGDFSWYFDMLVDRRAGGVEAHGGGAFRWTVEANWKAPAEAFAGDAYCDLTLHAATNAATDHTPPSRTEQGLQVTAGPGAFTMLTESSLYKPAPVLSAYEDSIAAETQARLGDERAHGFTPLIGTLFPNLSFDWRTRSLHVWQPRGPTLTEINTYCLVDCAAPSAVKDAMLRACQFHFGPAGLRAQDDVEPWTSLTERSGHMLAQRAPLNLQMGLGFELQRNIPGRVSDLFSEMNQRSFYGWWQDRLNEEEGPAESMMMQIAPPRRERSGPPSH